MKLPSIRQVYLEAKRASCRFPFVLCCALAGVIAALVLIEKEPKQGVIFPVLFSVALGIPFLAALALFTEKLKWRSGPCLSIQLLGMLLLVGYAFSVPTSFPQEPSGFFMRFALLIVGFVLLVMVLPYLKKGELNGFWQYNRTLYFRLFVTAIFSIVLFAGLAIALAALDNLFGVSVPGKRYGELWVLIVGLFSPWFFLSGVPEDLDSLDRVEEYPKGLKIFAQYILLSLVIVYLLILYAYLLKILMQWSWPKGWVSSLILGFSATSILSLLLMHPIRNRSENAWVRAAGKWLYIVLIPLIVVLFLAVMERIGDYGITESRYLGIALGIWLSAQVLYFLFSRSKSIKFTVVSLCLLAFLVSCGPWGMLSVSQRSQVGRLSRLLVKNRILIDGKVRKEHGKVSREDAQEISSIVSYLYQVHGYDAIQSWFADKLKENTNLGYARNLSPSKVLDSMGVGFISSRIRAGAVNFAVIASKQAEDISGYDRLLRGQVLSENSEHRFEGDGISYAADKHLDSMSITIGNPQAGFNTLRVNLSDFVERLLRDYGDAGSEVTQQMKPESMAVEIEQNGQTVKIFFQNLNLIRRNGNVTITSFTADIAYTVRK
jgi:hypothetical protein